MWKKLQKCWRILEFREKPIYYSNLAKRNNLIDFMLVFEQMNMIQNIMVKITKIPLKFLLKNK